LGLQSEAEVEMGAGEGGVLADGFGELLLGRGPVALLGVEGAEFIVQIGEGGLRLGAQGRFHLEDGLGKVAGGGEGAGVGGEKRRGEGMAGGFEGGEEREGLRGLADLLVGGGEVLLGEDVRVLNGEGGLQLVDRLLRVAAGNEDGAEGAVALLRAGGEVDDLLEVCLGGGEVVVRQGGLAGAVGGVGLTERGRDLLGERGTGEDGDCGCSSK
jgi:hypothetical protein